MTNNKLKLGSQGEDIAAKYLQSQGYKILQRNFRSRYGEIDIICRWEQTVIFVEVKTRTNTDFGSPEESITKTKQQHIHKVALIYLETYPYSFQEIRFDVIGILMDGSEPKLNHLEAAF